MSDVWNDGEQYPDSVLVNEDKLINCIHSAFCNYQICYDSLLITK